MFDGTISETIRGLDFEMCKKKYYTFSYKVSY